MYPLIIINFSIDKFNLKRLLNIWLTHVESYELMCVFFMSNPWEHKFVCQNSLRSKGIHVVPVLEYTFHYYSSYSFNEAFWKLSQNLKKNNEKKRKLKRSNTHYIYIYNLNHENNFDSSGANDSNINKKKLIHKK